jgi:hypothetical protein
MFGCCGYFRAAGTHGTSPTPAAWFARRAIAKRRSLMRFM